MVLRLLSTVLMLFWPRSSVLTAPRSCRMVSPAPKDGLRPVWSVLPPASPLVFRLFGCGLVLLDFSLTLEMFSLVVLTPLRPCLSNWWTASRAVFSTPEEMRSDAYSPGEPSSAYRPCSPLSLVRIYASFIRSEATAALSIALIVLSATLLVLIPLPIGFTSFPGRARPYASSSFATTTILPFVREYSQVERVMSLSPYSAVTPVS